MMRWLTFSLAIIVGLLAIIIASIFILQPTIRRSNVQINDDEVLRIAFGSCNKHDRPQKIWSSLSDRHPVVFVWLGDVVYADTQSKFLWTLWYPATPETMKAKFDAQLRVPEYDSFVASGVDIIGVYDDHDFGMNNGGGNQYEHRATGQQLFLDFLGIPKNSILRSRQGVYSSHLYGVEGHIVKIILLDSRYHKSSYGEIDGDFLKEEQWSWLETELSDGVAQFHIIGNGIQILPDRRIVQENWVRFPNARRRLLQTLRRAPNVPTLLLSGDVHFAEVSRLDCHSASSVDNKFAYWEITSSGLTHTWFNISPGLLGVIVRILVHLTQFFGFFDDFLVGGPRFHELNFGEIDIDWTREVIMFSVRGIDGSAAISIEQPFDALRVGGSDEDFDPDIQCIPANGRTPLLLQLFSCTLLPISVIGMLVFLYKCLRYLFNNLRRIH